MKKKKLPEPDCKYGYTHSQVEQIMGDREQEFNHWMYGQTMAICDGRDYDYEKKEYVPSGCDHPHGSITYTWDLKRFLDGLPVID
jgi:hypothetical protein